MLSVLQINQSNLILGVKSIKGEKRGLWMLFFPDLELSAVKMSKKMVFGNIYKLLNKRSHRISKRKLTWVQLHIFKSVVEEVPTGTRFEDLKDLKNGQWGPGKYASQIQFCIQTLLKKNVPLETIRIFFTYRSKTWSLILAKLKQTIELQQFLLITEPQLKRKTFVKALAEGS